MSSAPLGERAWRKPGSPGFQGALHLGLGVDEKVGAAHHALARAQACGHLVDVAELSAELEKPGLEPSGALVDKGDVVPAGRQHRIDWNREPFPFVQRERNVDIGVGPQLDRKSVVYGK